MCRPSSPSWARSTAKPSACSPRRTAAASRRSSSTTSTRTFWPSPFHGLPVASPVPHRDTTAAVCRMKAVPPGGTDPGRPAGQQGVSFMAAIPKLSRRTRWVVPAGVVAAVAAVGIASAITAAQAAPALPPRTPAQLLTGLAGPGKVPPLTGTVVETASLGIPQLPGSADPNTITSLLAGSHTVKVWYDGPQRVRLAVPDTMSESDFIRNGTTAWMWQSNSDSATKILLPKHRPGEREPVMPRTPLTPQQA